MELDPLTHRSHLVREIEIPESLWGAARLRISADGKTYAYGVYTTTADLYLLEGVR